MTSSFLCNHRLHHIWICLAVVFEYRFISTCYCYWGLGLWPLLHISRIAWQLYSVLGLFLFWNINGLQYSLYSDIVDHVVEELEVILYVVYVLNDLVCVLKQLFSCKFKFRVFIEEISVIYIDCWNWILERLRRTQWSDKPINNMYLDSSMEKGGPSSWANSAIGHFGY